MSSFVHKSWLDRVKGFVSDRQYQQLYDEELEKLQKQLLDQKHNELAATANNFLDEVLKDKDQITGWLGVGNRKNNLLSTMRDWGYAVFCQELEDISPDNKNLAVTGKYILETELRRSVNQAFEMMGEERETKSKQFIEGFGQKILEFAAETKKSYALLEEEAEKKVVERIGTENEGKAQRRM